MEHFTRLVTPDGEWISPNTPEFFAALGDPDPDYDAVAFAVKNLGFIKFQVIQHSIVEIELHPHNIELPALLAVQQQLLSSGMKLFRIKYFDNDWRSEISSSAEHAIERLSHLCAPVFAPTPSDRFVVEAQDYATLFDDEECPFRPLAQKWRMSFGVFDPSVISLAVKHNLISRLMIVGVKPRRDDPVFRFVGDGHSNWLDPKSHHNIIGEKVENLPDKDYGSWVAQFYKNVASTGQPRYDHITASIRCQSKAVKTRYERLLLPWRTPSDEILVTMWSRGIGADIVPLRPSSQSAISSSMKSARSA